MFVCFGLGGQWVGLVRFVLAYCFFWGWVLSGWPVGGFVCFGDVGLFFFSFAFVCGLGAGGFVWIWVCLFVFVLLLWWRCLRFPVISSSGFGVVCFWLCVFVIVLDACAFG